jgi:hypothetical protein
MSLSLNLVGDVLKRVDGTLGTVDVVLGPVDGTLREVSGTLDNVEELLGGATEVLGDVRSLLVELQAQRLRNRWCRARMSPPISEASKKQARPTRSHHAAVRSIAATRRHRPGVCEEGEAWWQLPCAAPPRSQLEIPVGHPMATVARRNTA